MGDLCLYHQSLALVRPPLLSFHLSIHRRRKVRKESILKRDVTPVLTTTLCCSPGRSFDSTNLHKLTMREQNEDRSHSGINGSVCSALGGFFSSLFSFSLSNQLGGTSSYTTGSKRKRIRSRNYIHRYRKNFPL